MMNKFCGRVNARFALNNFLVRTIHNIQVSRDHEAGVASIFLNRVSKKNAFDMAMYKETNTFLQNITTDNNIKVLLLSGRGDFYTAGNDITNFSKIMNPLKMSREFRYDLEQFILGLLTFPKPIVCAVNGPAIGIGVTTLALFDKVYANETAYFHAPFAALGAAPEGCSSYLFPRIMGEKLANEVLWEGKKLSASEALRAGLVHEIISSKSLLASATAYCHQLAALPSHSLELQRKIHREGLLEELIKVNKEEWDILQNKIVSKDGLRAVIRFLEGRKQYLPAIYLRYAYLIRVTSFPHNYI